MCFGLAIQYCDRLYCHKGTSQEFLNWKPFTLNQWRTFICTLTLSNSVASEGLHLCDYNLLFLLLFFYANAYKIRETLLRQCCITVQLDIIALAFQLFRDDFRKHFFLHSE